MLVTASCHLEVLADGTLRGRLELLPQRTDRHQVSINYLVMQVSQLRRGYLAGAAALAGRWHLGLRRYLHR